MQKPWYLDENRDGEEDEDLTKLLSEPVYDEGDEDEDENGLEYCYACLIAHVKTPTPMYCEECGRAVCEEHSHVVTEYSGSEPPNAFDVCYECSPNRDDDDN